MQQEESDMFTAEEQERFQRRCQEGYDLTNDERYNLWLKRHESVCTRLFSESEEASTSTDSKVTPPDSGETMPGSEETLPGSEKASAGSQEVSPDPNPHLKSKLSAFLPVPTVPQKSTKKPSEVRC